MYLIIGANGFLGSYIIKNVLEHTTDKVLATARDVSGMQSDDRIRWQKFDITNPADSDSIHKMMAESNEDYKVIVLAAYHHPDMVEKHPHDAWNTNVTCLSYFLNGMSHVQCMFYPSTDSVYGESIDGKHFGETDELKPVNTYGRQKTVAEKVVNGLGYNVVRYPFLAGHSLSPKKSHFCDMIIDTVKSGKPMELFEDSYRSSIDFNQAAYYMIKLIENYSDSMAKVINICGDQDLSKYDVGMILADRYGLDKKLIVPISISAGEDIFETKRASSTLMNNSVLKKTLGIDKIEIEL